MAAPAAALVVAEPGAGRSWLLAEVRKHKFLKTDLSLLGYEPERRVPLTAAREILRRLGLAGRELTDLSGGPLEPLRLFDRRPSRRVAKDRGATRVDRLGENRTELAVAISEAPQDAPDVPDELGIGGVPR